MKSILSIFLCVNAVFARKGLGPTEQEWGFITVRQGAHMFWWLHQTSAEVENYSERPLIIWLQGGPGASSTGFGNFAELGPLDADLNSRSSTWIKSYNVLFVDNPVGVGFSHVDTSSYLTTTNRQIAEDFLVFLKEFYKTIPDLKNTPLFIFAESYGGKMAAEIALVVDEAIKKKDLEIDLVGIGLGDAWISPIDTVLSWAPYLLSLGTVDLHGYDQIQLAAKQTKAAFDHRDYVLATQLWAYTESVIKEVTADIDFYNVLTKISSGQLKTKNGIIKPSFLRDTLDDKINVLMNDEVSKALDLNVTWGNQAADVFNALSEDFMLPVTDIVEKILNTTDIKVTVFNGQLDLIVDTPGTVEWVDKLKFEEAKHWKTSPRKTIVANGIIEGFYKKVGNLAMYWVNRAGHMVPLDNPAAMEFILADMTEGYYNKI